MEVITKERMDIRGLNIRKATAIKFESGNIICFNDKYSKEKLKEIIGEKLAFGICLSCGENSVVVEKDVKYYYMKIVCSECGFNFSEKEVKLFLK